MHPLEAKLGSVLERGDDPSVALLGGVAAIAEAAETLGRSPNMPAVLAALIRYWPSATAAEIAMLQRAFQTLIREASADFVLMEAVDLLDASQPLPLEADDFCFSTFLQKAQDNTNLSGLARSVALEGALRWAMSNRRRQLRLLDLLLGIAPDDDSEFLRHAAKIMGLAYAHWREAELVPRLMEITTIEDARADASFELGMAKLAQGLDSSGRDAAQELFAEARDSFQASTTVSGINAGARMYVECLDLLTKYSVDAEAIELKEGCKRIRRDLFELAAYEAAHDRQSWIGARHQEAICWSVLANTLSSLAAELDETSWWEPAAVIEDHLLAAYTAGRSILGRGMDGSLHSLIRPRIEASLARHQGQAYQLKAWLRRNPAHVNAAEAVALINKIDHLFDVGDPEARNPPRATGEFPLATLIERAHFSTEVKSVLLQVATNALSLQLDNLTLAESRLIEDCRRTVADHPDHKENIHGRRLYDAVLLWAVRFLFNRLEVTQKDDPTVAYLFEKADGSLPTEDELQGDFFRWVSTASAGTDLEPTNIGGGRADVRVRSSNERIVIEVKRELIDSSFDTLAAWYAGQATDYQNVSIRLGFLLVLDLATPNRDGTPHLSSLMETREVHRSGEKLPRLMTIVKIPGRRLRPSDISKSAKKQQIG